MMAGGARAKDLKLTREIDQSIPPLLIGDAGRFRQMLLILIGNAIKFTERGEVFVSAAASQPDAASAELRVSVHDTGIGIAPEHRRKLFESFYQSDGSTTRKHGGAGLGLAICQRLAHLMGGKVEVESQVGKGSTFTLTVRLELPAEELAGGLIELFDVTRENARAHYGPQMNADKRR
jgi:signal transduction histidine kinase